MEHPDGRLTELFDVCMNGFNGIVERFAECLHTLARSAVLLTNLRDSGVRTSQRAHQSKQHDNIKHPQFALERPIESECRQHKNRSGTERQRTGKKHPCDVVDTTHDVCKKPSPRGDNDAWCQNLCKIRIDLERFLCRNIRHMRGESTT
jgi:hypothetical protein